MLNIIYYFLNLFLLSKILILLLIRVVDLTLSNCIVLFSYHGEKLAQAIGMGPASFGLKHKFNYNLTQENTKPSIRI
jgi:hypothetical protein